MTSPHRQEGECEVDSIDELAVDSVLDELADDRKIHAISDIFAALGDPTRMRILTALSVKELCVCDISAAIEVSQSAVSHQLRTLRQLDLVAYRRDGKRAVYHLADEHVRTLLEQGREHAEERFGGESNA